MIAISGYHWFYCLFFPGINKRISKRIAMWKMHEQTGCGNSVLDSKLADNLYQIIGGWEVVCQLRDVLAQLVVEDVLRVGQVVVKESRFSVRIKPMLKMYYSCTVNFASCQYANDYEKNNFLSKQISVLSNNGSVYFTLKD